MRRNPLALLTILLRPQLVESWRRGPSCVHRARCVMCSGAESDESLQSVLKRAASEKLGASLESAIKPEDRSLYASGPTSMANALQEAKKRLEERKAAIGEDQALAELDAAIRTEGRAAEGRAAASPLLKARPKLFLLDRDGVINADVGAPGVTRVEDLAIIPGSAGALRRLRLSGKVAIITNQSARGKGLLSAETLDEIHEELRHLVATTARGGLVGREQWDGLYVCTDAGPSARKKPEPGMVLEALDDFGCTPNEAVLIGDSWSDIVAARRAGCVGVLLTTGHGQSLGALLQKNGVTLPITLSVRVEASGADATEFVKLQRDLATERDGGVARTVEEWISTRSEAEAALVWEALRTDVRIYRDLLQAVDELVAAASEL